MPEFTTVIHVEYRGAGAAEGIAIMFGGDSKTTDKKGNAKFKFVGSTKESFKLFVNKDKKGEHQVGDQYDFFIDKKK